MLQGWPLTAEYWHSFTTIVPVKQETTTYVGFNSKATMLVSSFWYCDTFCWLSKSFVSYCPLLHPYWEATYSGTPDRRGFASLSCQILSLGLLAFPNRGLPLPAFDVLFRFRMMSAGGFRLHCRCEHPYNLCFHM